MVLRYRLQVKIHNNSKKSIKTYWKTFTVSINVCVAKNYSMHRALPHVWKPSVACWPTVQKASFPSLLFTRSSADADNALDAKEAVPNK